MKVPAGFYKGQWEQVLSALYYGYIQIPSYTGALPHLIRVNRELEENDGGPCLRDRESTEGSL